MHIIKLHVNLSYLELTLPGGPPAAWAECNNLTLAPRKLHEEKELATQVENVRQIKVVLGDISPISDFQLLSFP